MESENLEINLLPYIIRLIRNWYWIVIGAVVFTALGIAYSRLKPIQYNSTAYILLVNKSANLNLSQEYQTTNQGVDMATRVKGILSFAESESFAAQAWSALQKDIYPKVKNYNDLKNLVSIQNTGDVIEITAHSNDPQISANIANGWGDQLVSVINNAYSGDQPITDIHAQVVKSLDDYHKAQSNLENFLASNNLFEVQTQLDSTKQLYQQTSDDRLWQVAYLTERKNNMDQIITQAEALKQQIGAGNTTTAASLGDALAVLSARANALLVQESQPDMMTSVNSQNTSGQKNNANQSMDENTPSSNTILVSPGQQATNNNITFDLKASDLVSTTTSAGLVADLDRMIQQAQIEKGKAEEEIKTISRELLSSTKSDTEAAAIVQIQSLETRLEQEQSKQNDLSNQRDIAYQAYQALAKKEVEIKNASQVNNEIVMATRATPPLLPAPKNTIQNGLISGAFGFFLVVLVLLAMEWWNSNKKIVYEMSEASTNLSRAKAS